jgi:hypothetical protein
VFARLRAAIDARYKRWLDRRIPRQRLVTLDQRRIFIFPGPRGALFVVLLMLLFLGGINYANNQVLLLCFLLAALLNTSILHTYRNVSGCVLRRDVRTAAWPVKRWIWKWCSPALPGARTAGCC